MTRPTMLIAALLASACTPPTPPAPPAEPTTPAAEMRVYTVPEAFRGEIRGVVSSLLWRGKGQPTAGTAALGPGGTLLVTAPPEFHRGVADLVARVEKNRPAAPPSLEMQYWVLLGRAAETASPIEGFDPAIRSVAEALQKRHGPMDLRMLERMQVRTISGEHAEAEGANARVRQKASVHGTSLLAELNFMPGEGRDFETRVQIPVGEVVVLGYAGLSGKLVERTFPEMQPTEPAPTAYYIVRGSVVGAK